MGLDYHEQSEAFYVRLLSDERTVVACETADDIKRGDLVWVDWKGRVQRLREPSPFENYIALYDAQKGTQVALFGTRWNAPY